MGKDDKTNVMRLLDSAKIQYVDRAYDPDVTDGEKVAALVGTDPDQTFKTLVTVSESGKNYVFVIPVNRELDLKAAARSVGEKRLEMLPQKFLFSLTGYVHGGCSPVGMKKQLKTVFDRSATQFCSITLSAGKKGRQITVSSQELISFLSAFVSDLSREKTTSRS